MTLVQLAVWVWARNVAVTAAYEGARTAAESQRDLEEGISKTQSVLHDGLGQRANLFEVQAAQEDEQIVVVTRGRAPRVVPFVPEFPINISATAFDEDEIFR